MVRRCLNEAAAKYNRPLLKALLTENHRMNHLKRAQDHKAIDWNQVISSNETIIRLNCVKGLLWNLPEKRKGHANCQASNQSQSFRLPLK